MNKKLLFGLVLVFIFELSCGISRNKNLIEAARVADYTKISEYLENGADPNYQDASGKAALHQLCSLPSTRDTNQNIDSVIFSLIQHGANINLPDKNGNTPLFYAIQSGNYEMSTSLINHGADVNFRNKNHRTPLFNAVAFIIIGVKEIRSMQFVRLLHQAGADIFVKDKEGKNLMHISKDPAVTTWLIEHGLSPKLKDNYGKTPLDYSSAEIFKLRDSIAGYSRATDKSRN